MLEEGDHNLYGPLLLKLSQLNPTSPPPSGLVQCDYQEAVKLISPNCLDLLFLDPPYNLDKDFNGAKFRSQSIESYSKWLDGVLTSLKPLLKATATIYICGDWLSSLSIYDVAREHFYVRNRITWEREKGRGATKNWKASSEDIWFCTVSNNYTFNVDAVKLRRKVLAPYRQDSGAPKDWLESADGNFRDTYPSNLWTDISIPFWSMPENTDHPTQKSEKFMAKLILASTNPKDLVFDPFAGSGTTCVTASKLGRRYLGCELNEEFCLLGQKRLELAKKYPEIQGFRDGIFWERNSKEK